MRAPPAAASLLLLVVLTACDGGDAPALEADLAGARATGDAARDPTDAARLDGLDAGAPDGGSSPPVDGAPTADAGLTVASCYAGLGAKGPVPDYDQFHPVVGKHCHGTDHQDITGIERVVFLGDSVTVGTPPYLPHQYYRTIVGDAVAKKYGLNAFLDVASCAEWGARTDDLLLKPKEQIKKCFNTQQEKKRTLVVMTVGGNDLNSIAKKGQSGTALPQLLQQVDQAIGYLRDAIAYLQDAQRFPKGVAIVMTNVYEFTDGTGDLLSCPAAAAAGYTNDPWPDGPKVFIYMNEQIVKLAVEKKVDVVFMEEEFCGHGFKRDDPNAACYRGPGQKLWFDPFSCIHPNDVGHAALAGFFLDVINN